MYHLNLSVICRLSGRAALLGLLLLLPFALPQAQAAPDQSHPGREIRSQTAQVSAKTTVSHSVMNHSSGQGRDYSDRAFLSSMIAHHEGAVNMADQLLRSTPGSVNPTLARWAREIRKKQSEEIRNMRALLNTMGGLDKATYQEMSQQMAGMMDQGQGLEPNVRFVVLMLPHHAGAVEMALPALLYSDSGRIVHLAQDIIEERSEEIAELRDWLSQQHHSL